LAQNLSTPSMADVRKSRAPLYANVWAASLAALDIMGTQL
jgi:hypothetical protein